MVKDVGMAVPKTRETRVVYMPQDKRLWHTTMPQDELFLKEKLAVLGGTRTHDNLLSRQRSYQLSYRGSSAGWAQIT